MINILTIFKNDVRIIRNNVMTALIVFAVSIVPLLFTSFNVLASWDPFSNTENLKIAVASTDRGYKSDLTALDINLGDQVLSQLSRNDEINWQITSKDDAIHGTESGEYYAAIVLPETFSRDLLTFYIEGKDPTKLDLYTNQKKNALSTMITSRGAEGVIAKIDGSFTKVVSNAALGVVESLDRYFNKDGTQNALDRVSNRLENVSRQLGDGATTARSFGSLLDATIPLVQGANDILEAARNPVAGSPEQIDSAPITDLQGALGASADSLDGALASTAQSYEAVERQLQGVSDATRASTTDSAGLFRSMGQRVQQQADGFKAVRTSLDNSVGPVVPPAARPSYDLAVGRLDAVIAQSEDLHNGLIKTADDLDRGAATSADSRARAKDSVAKAIAVVKQARTAYNNDLKPQLDSLKQSVNQVINDVDTVKASLGEISADLAKNPNSAQNALVDARNAANGMADRLQQQADRINEILAAAREARDTGDYKKLADLIHGDPEVLATRIASPVAVDREAVFPVKTFGVGMTPFYTVLALWIGALLANVLVKSNAENAYFSTAATSGHDEEPGEEKRSDPENSAAESGDFVANAEPDRSQHELAADNSDLAVAAAQSGRNFTRNQVFLGRYLLFALIGFAQSTLVSLGLIGFVEIEAAHPFLLILAMWVASLVFMMIIYALVVAFDNAGKALGVLLLVFQVSGASGAYPLPLLPQWFQNMNPWLPATYAVEAFRSAIAGVYQGDYWNYLGMLALFAIPALILGLWLRRLMDGYLNKMKQEIVKTKVMATP